MSISIKNKNQFFFLIKRLSFIFFLVQLFFSAVLSQTWAPKDAIWYYGLRHSPVSSNAEGYLKYIVTGDSVAFGKTCSILKKYKTTSTNITTEEGIELMFSENNKVYHLINNSYYVLYDFNAKAEDTWQIRIPYEMFGYSLQQDSMRTITVDSVKYISTNKGLIKALYVHSNIMDWKFKNPILESFGADFMFAGVWGLWDTDIPYLRCYNDSALSYQPRTSVACDTIFTTSENTLNEIDDLPPFPNPFHYFTTLRFQQTFNHSFFIEILDTQGKVIYQAFETSLKNGNNYYSIGENLTKGIYLLIIRVNDLSYHFKIIKT